MLDSRRKTLTRYRSQRPAQRTCENVTPLVGCQSQQAFGQIARQTEAISPQHGPTGPGRSLNALLFHTGLQTASRW